MNGWRSGEFTSSQTVTEILAADAQINRRYQRNDGVYVWLSVAYFAKQQVNSQIHSPPNCLRGSGWSLNDIKEVTIRFDGGENPAKRMLISKQERRQEVLYCFRTQSGTIADEYALKWDLMKSSILRRPTNAAFVRYNFDPAESDAAMELISALQPHLDEILGEVGLR